MTENFESKLKNSSELIFTLKLSGRSFRKGLGLSVSKSERFIGNRIRSIYCFDIDLEINTSFLDCDLKDNVEFFLNDKIIFRGVIKESFVEGKMARLVTQDISLKFDYISFIGLEASPFLGIREMLSLLITPFEELRLGDISDIPDTSIKDFIVIVPVKNLIFGENFNIGRVEFYNDFDKIDDKLIRGSNTWRSVPDWNSYHSRAKVIIKNSEFIMALNDGYKEISSSIDLIALRTDLSFPKLEISGKHEYQHFHYQELVAQVTIPTWIYCREDGTNSWAIINLKFIKENDLKLSNNSREFFEKIDQLFLEFLNRDSIKNDKKLLLMSIHWLRRSIQSGDNKDKMLDLWTSMEFVMSGTKATPLFCDDQIESITRLLSKNLDSLALTTKQTDALFKKLNDLNEAPLMARIFSLIRILGIDLTDDEKDLLTTARKVACRNCCKIHSGPVS